MELQDFIKLVKKRFSFIMENEKEILYTYSRSGNCIIVFQANGYKIKIVEDRGIAEILGAPNNAPNGPSREWYDLISVISFVTQGPKQVNLKYSQKWWISNEEKSVDSQMIRLVQILDPYWSSISDFFSQEGFRERQKELDKYREGEVSNKQRNSRNLSSKSSDNI
jgi:hypothetical protein